MIDFCLFVGLQKTLICFYSIREGGCFGCWFWLVGLSIQYFHDLMMLFSFVIKVDDCPSLDCTILLFFVRYPFFISFHS